MAIPPNMTTFGCFFLFSLLFSSFSNAKAANIPYSQLSTAPEVDDLPPQYEYEIELHVTFANARLKKAYQALQSWKKAIFSDPFNMTGNWVGANVCAYNGVYCARALDDPTASVVAGVDLNQASTISRCCENSISATIVLSANSPRLFWTYRILKYVDLRYNEFEGSLPPELFEKELDAIFLNNNRFTSTIPDTLGKSPGFRGGFCQQQIERVHSEEHWEHDKHRGSNFLKQRHERLPPRGNRVLDFAKNQLTGAVPDSICTLPSLKNFTLADNFFKRVGKSCYSNSRLVLNDKTNCLEQRPRQKSKAICLPVVTKPVDCSKKCRDNPGEASPRKRGKSRKKGKQQKQKHLRHLKKTAVEVADGAVGVFSSFSVFSDLQKAATVAAEEISRNAAEVAKTAAKSIADIQNVAEDSESSEGDVEESIVEGEEKDEHDKRRKAALDKLEKASEDSLLGQARAWQALGSAWRGGSNLVHKIEHSAVNLAESIQHGGLPAPGSVAPSIIKSGKAFTAKGMQVLELVGKEAIDLLITETGIDIDGNMKRAQPQDNEDQLFEEVTFDRCFYIYGGPEHLEELEALSNHYTLLFNRRKVKLSPEQKSFYERKLKQVQQIFSLSFEIEGNAEELEKGKKIESGAEDSADEMKNLHDSSVRKAAEMAAGFTNALAGLATNDIIQRTASRLDSLHSEGVHRLSEMCCSAVSQLLMLAKSIISTANKAQEEDVDDDICIADVAEAYVAAMKGAAADSKEVSTHHKSIQEKADSISENLHSDRATAVGKIQDGLEYLTYIVSSTSMSVA
ncbi:hypothetical protein Acr_07g0001720 [Actinidia rufa]|uniref:DUF7798 domain-containing protein n=1 Tax=Actinidia rufa TaxID=165716 RepID=A0A7J0EU00_9ERIC|nr:hypothetical protein Acr_07g0001720 [Actinidia rufa]